MSDAYGRLADQFAAYGAEASARIAELEAALDRAEAGRQKAEDDFNRLVQAFSETNAHQVVRVAELEQDLRMSEAGRIAAEEELAVVRQARQDAEEHLNAYRKALAVLREEEAEVRARREAPCASEPDATTEGETP